MVIYLGMFSLSILFIVIAKQYGKKDIRRNCCIIFALLLPCLLAGLRDYTIGADVLNYGNYWFMRATLAHSNPSDYFAAADRGSIGLAYAFLNFIVSLFTNSAHWLYFILAVLEIIILYFSVKPFEKTISIAFSFFIFYMVYYNDSLNALRQMPAMLLVLFSYRYVRMRKIISFVIVIVIATLFHITAIMGLLIYPLAVLSESKLKDIFNVVIFALMVASVFLFSEVFNLLVRLNFLSAERYGHYLENEDTTGGRFVRIALFLFIFLIFTIKRKWLTSKYKELQSSYMYMLFSAVLSMLLLIYSSAYIIRIAYYFDVFMVIYIPYMVKGVGIKVNSVRRHYPKYIILGTVFFVYWIFVYAIRNGAATIPYMFMQS